MEVGVTSTSVIGGRLQYGNGGILSRSQEKANVAARSNMANLYS
jgi:hypothetical protein